MSRKAVWCFTYPVDADERKVSKDGIEFNHHSKTYKLVIGPVEQPDSNTDYPHQHGYIQCPVSTALTKGQATAILRDAGLYKEGMYLHELETTKAKYHSYCFKSDGAANNNAERAIKRAYKHIEETDGVKVTKKRLTTQLAKIEGAAFVARNKQIIDVTLATPEIYKDNKTVDESVDVQENMRNYMQCVTNFKQIITNAVTKHGIVTTHKLFQDCSREDQINAVVAIALLPTVARRKRITDGLPALWFHGLPNCGKSYLFSQIPNYKKIATDAEGVGRFRMEGEQTAYLIDDVDAGWIFKPANSKTMKALAVGERDVIKTFGDTQEVRGFCVLTSNCIPDHLCPCPPVPEGGDAELFKKSHEYNCNAWKRRIISLFFDETADYDSIFVDFEMLSLDIVARRAFTIACKSIVSPALKSAFEVYYNHVESVWTEDDVTLYNSVFETVERASV
jgi:hypothetical protein